MRDFLAAQAVDPSDPTPLLIHADWFEERGDATGAAVFRALAASGTPSIAALALEVGSAVPRSFSGGLDSYDWAHGEGCGDGDRIGLLMFDYESRDGFSMRGYGDGGGEDLTRGEGSSDGDPDGWGLGGGDVNFIEGEGFYGEGELLNEENPSA